MPATTRSKAKQRSHIEEYTDEKLKYQPLLAADKRVSSGPAQASKATSTGAARKGPGAEPVRRGKRKQLADSEGGDQSVLPNKKKINAASSQPDGEKNSKMLPEQAHGKQSRFENGEISNLQNPIIINRAPVLQLWGAILVSFIHPELSWPTCLSIGNAISSLCAISKGKSICVIERKDDDPVERSKRKDTEKKKGKEKGVREVQVMGFPLHVKGEAVLLGGKGKPLNEGTLKGKFGGDEMYDAAGEVMRNSLKEWKGNEEELNKKAFHMYERFRPSVAAGQKGWGRKGELNLKRVESAVRK